MIGSEIICPLEETFSDLQGYNRSKHDPEMSGEMVEIVSGSGYKAVPDRKLIPRMTSRRG